MGSSKTDRPRYLTSARGDNTFWYDAFLETSPLKAEMKPTMLPEMTISRSLRLATILTLSLSLPTVAEDPVGETEAVSSQPPGAILTQFCVRCHNEKTRTADLRLDDIRVEESDLTRWEKVLEMVSIGDMPPDEAKQPSRSQREQLTNRLLKKSV